MDHRVPSNEADRLACLHSCNILDTAQDERFDRLTRLVRLALNMPAVLISIVDKDRIWYKSRQGFDLPEYKRSPSFCEYAIMHDEPLIVPDATRHSLFNSMPFVVGEPHFRFYIGIPLKMSDGHIIGTLCALDYQARNLAAGEIEIMKDLAQIVIDQIELHRTATTDALTGALTRRAFDTEMDHVFKRSRDSEQEFSLIALDIDHFKSVNDRYGHACGDLVLKSVVALIRQDLRQGDIVARIGGEEFAILAPRTTSGDATILAEKIRQRIANAVLFTNADNVNVTASFGISCLDASDRGWPHTLARADAALYEAKRGGRNRCVWRSQTAKASAAA